MGAASCLLATRPTILARDLNATKDTKTLGVIMKEFSCPHSEPLPTIPVGKPTRQIDFVCPIRGNRLGLRFWTKPSPRIHRPLLVEIDLLPPRQ
jgi:hypothetical protein